MDALGADLKKAREANGLSIREVAARTKISVTALEALERNDPSRLPGGIFGRSFVRAYATEVGLDPETTVERFVALLERDEEERAERRRAAQPAISDDDRAFLERQRRAVLVARVVMALAVIGLAALIVWGVRIVWPLRDAPSEAEVTSALPTPPGAPAATASAFPAEPGSATPAGDPAATSPKLVIELSTTGETTIAVAADGQPEASRAYRAGERLRIEVDRDLLIDASNAGVVSLAVDGRPAKSLGAPGARVRTRITRENAGQF